MRQRCLCLGIVPLILSIVAVACGGPSPEKAALTKDVVLRTLDGVSLGATLYPINQPNPPGLVLIHMLGSNRGAWKSFASRAQAGGYLCVAIDLRGHGDSQNARGTRISYKDFTTQDWLAALDDVETAKQALLKEGANPKNIAVIGASIGANLALHYAVENSDVPAIVMISPGLDYKGVKTGDEIAAFGQRPCLLVTTEGDSYSESSCTTLKRDASGLCELREYPGSAHGTAIFDASPTALEEVLIWLKPIFNPSSPK